MKNPGICAALAAMVLASVSCDPSRYIDGAWEPIEMDKAEVHFTAEGGEETVTVLNYSSWWMHYGYEDTYFEGGSLKYVNSVSATSSGGPDTYTYDLLDGGWYHAVVPEKSRSNKLVITVDPNTTSASRHATIHLSVGDAFGSVRIIQD